MSAAPERAARPAPLAPGASLGVVGGGQLGRYFVLEARRLGYDTWVLDPDPGAPAMQLAAHPLVAAYDDADALERLGAGCDAVTVEFENVPAASLERLAGLTRVAPAAGSVAIAQDRAAEKRVALAHGLEPVPHGVIERESDIDAAVARAGLPAILKSARLGYDGKGQVRCEDAAAVRRAWHGLGGVPAVLEKRVALERELSVVLARGFDGASVVFPVAANVHEGGILATSTVPSGAPPALEARVGELAVALADGIDHVGVLAVEFFVDVDGALWFNEMAPRPHNSGHYTLDACAASQFEQQLRALAALPLAPSELLSPVAMLNLLGERWGGSEPDWSGALECPGAVLHLYGKARARPGRKMGHVNCLARDTEAALERLASVDRRTVPRSP